jgi:hypothetical protein
MNQVRLWKFRPISCNSIAATLWRDGAWLGGPPWVGFANTYIGSGEIASECGDWCSDGVTKAAAAAAAAADKCPACGVSFDEPLPRKAE